MSFRIPFPLNPLLLSSAQRIAKSNVLAVVFVHGAGGAPIGGSMRVCLLVGTSTGSWTKRLAPSIFSPSAKGIEYPAVSPVLSLYPLRSFYLVPVRGGRRTLEEYGFSLFRGTLTSRILELFKPLERTFSVRDLEEGGAGSAKRALQRKFFSAQNTEFSMELWNLIRR